MSKKLLKKLPAKKVKSKILREYTFPIGHKLIMKKRGNKDYIRAYDSHGKLVTSGFLDKIKGGFYSAIKNYKLTRTFKPKDKVEYIVEKNHYKNGIKQVGIFKGFAKTNPDIPKHEIYQYAVQAIMKDGNQITGASPKIPQNNLSIEQARNMAYANLYKQFSAIYSRQYGEDTGKKSFEFHKKKLKDMVVEREGWVYYDKSGFRKGAKTKIHKIIPTRKTSKRKRH